MSALNRYMQTRGLTDRALADQCELIAPAVLGRPFNVPQQTINAIKHGRLPRRDLMRLIYVASGGAVDANALVELPRDLARKVALEGVVALVPPGPAP